jgi:hypothetical protein
MESLTWELKIQVCASVSPNPEPSPRNFHPSCNDQDPLVVYTRTASGRGSQTEVSYQMIRQGNICELTRTRTTAPGSWWSVALAFAAKQPAESSALVCLQPDRLLHDICPQTSRSRRSQETDWVHWDAPLLRAAPRRHHAVARPASRGLGYPNLRSLFQGFKQDKQPSCRSLEAPAEGLWPSAGDVTCNRSPGPHYLTATMTSLEQVR